ncbi:sigma-70 family RNA polymerase sigma factor [uncultured Flavonifractor sp.]|uniref:sigma-70 family RNA polymerase sigma factor n=1 Tax=uncultured Flavonifractor sp. TaxID=1193534 RepID=UPI00259A662D|nr:sigma-70 family RNA polymerase sigma factor [uncultured Flavonifractor sp.]
MMETVVVPAGKREFNAYMDEDGNRIVWSIIYRYGSGLDRDEAYQELSIAVWKALEAYVSGKKTKVSTFVYQAAYNRMKMLLREQSATKRMIERQSASVEEAPGLHSCETALEEDAVEHLVMENRAKALHWAVRNSGLTREEYGVIVRTLKDMNQRQIAAELGSSQSHVSILKTRAMAKIKEALMSAQWDGESIWVPDIS